MIVLLQLFAACASLLEYCQSIINQIGKQQEDKTQGNCNRETAPARFQNDSSCQHPGLILDISANHHRCPNFRNYAAINAASSSSRVSRHMAKIACNCEAPNPNN